MDQSEYQNLQNLTYQLITSQSLKKITQLLVSVSLFSFLCSYSSFYSFLYNSFKFYLSAFPFQITSKNCIFLIFNGILVFLAKTSGLLQYSWSGFDPMEPKFIKKITDGLQIETEKKEEILVDIKEEENEVRGGEISINEERESSNLMVKEEEEDESGLLSREGEGESGTFVTENHEEKQKESGFLFEEEEVEIGEVEEEVEIGEVEEEDIRKLSTAELNKKFDDFIRRMKEEIRIEAKQPLILV